MSRSRPFKSERHLALAQDTQPMVNPFGPWKLPDTWARCGGGCDQGRRLCVTPAACQIPERDPIRVRTRPQFLVALVVVAILAAIVWVSR